MHNIEAVLSLFPQQSAALFETVANLKSAVDCYKAENERLASFADRRLEVSGMLTGRAEDETLPEDIREGLFTVAAVLWEKTEEEYQILLAASDAAEAAVEEVRGELADRANTLRLMVSTVPGDGAQDALTLLDHLEALASCSSEEESRGIIASMVDAVPELILALR